MHEGEPSRTAFGAAIHRAVHPELDRPVVFHDPLARRILGEPFTERWAQGELPALLVSLGFDDVEALGRPEIRERYLGLPPGPSGGGGHVLRARRLS